MPVFYWQFPNYAVAISLQRHMLFQFDSIIGLPGLPSGPVIITWIAYVCTHTNHDLSTEKDVFLSICYKIHLSFNHVTLKLAGLARMTGIPELYLVFLGLRFHT